LLSLQKYVIPLLRRYLPIVAWLPGYRRADLRPDLVAGAISWAVMVPVAMAYAQMAGVPAQAGLYASIVSLMVYGILVVSLFNLGASGDLDVPTMDLMADVAVKLRERGAALKWPAWAHIGRHTR
jgi:MFS superfamily sulfate permease-like transporter